MPPRRRAPGRGDHEKRSLALVPLAPLQSSELDDYADEEKRAEALVLSLKGYSNLQIAERFGIHRNSVSTWLKRARQEHRSRLESSDEVLGEVMATYRAVMTEAWKAHAQVDVDQLSGSNYLRLILDSAKELAKLAGVDQAPEAAKGKTEVLVQIGGENGLKVGMRA